MGAKKYTESTLDYLLKVAMSQKMMTADDLHNYTNNLFETVQVGSWETLKNEVINCDSLKATAYVNSMEQLNSLYGKVKKDLEAFKSKSIEVKLKAFRLANFLDVEPDSYLNHEDKIRKIIGKENINSGKELLMRLKQDDTSDYALLTSPVRKRFEKTFAPEIQAIRASITESALLTPNQVKENEIRNRQKRINKLNA